MAIPEARKYTEEEFYAMGEGRFELIDGYIVDMSPTPNQRHQRISGRIYRKISDYIDSLNGKCEPFEVSDVKLDEGIIVIPDLYVTCDPEKLDGQKHNGAPDWVIEIVSPSSVSHDYYNKLNLYKKYGVKEYWIIDPLKNHTTVHIWDGDFIDVGHYSWNDDIPVYIYKDNTPPLVLNLAAMLGEERPGEGNR